MAPPLKAYALSSFLMAGLFAFSASVQFDDPDWYFWIPLYTFGCAVNVMSCWPSKLSPRTIQGMGKLALWLGVFLFIKATLEASLAGETVKASGIWSLDMRERVVREKLGSGLVFVSMILQLAASCALCSDPVEKKMLEIETHFDYGIRVVVAMAITCRLFLIFLALVIGSMIMHSASSTVLEDPNAPWQVKLGKYVDYGILFLICLCYGLPFIFTVLFIVSVVFHSAMPLAPEGKNDNSKKNDKKKKLKLQAYAEYGMGALMGISYGLSVVFYVYHKDEMKF